MAGPQTPTTTIVSGSNISIDIEANVESTTLAPEVWPNGDELLTASKSLKSLRTYQIGVVYKDVYGRETPVLTSEKATFTTLKELGETQNRVTTKINSDAPYWADSYKFFIKETSNEYYNVCMDRWYDAKDGNIWLSFPSAERNKINEETFIILKKQSGKDKLIKEDARFKVIDIKSEAPEFIKTKYDSYGVHDLDILAGGPATEGEKFIVVDWTDSSGTDHWTASPFYGGSTSDSDPGAKINFVGDMEDLHLRMKASTGTRTDWIEVTNITYSPAHSNEVLINLREPLPQGIRGVTGENGNDTVTFDLARKEVRNLPEFDGRFFVKIRRTPSVDKYIRNVGNPASPWYTVTNMPQRYLNRGWNSSTQEWEDGRDKGWWEDSFGGSNDESWFIDAENRGGVLSNFDLSTYYPEDRGYGIYGDGSGGGPSRNDTSSMATVSSNYYGVSKSWLRCTMELSVSKVNDSVKDSFDLSSNTTITQDFYQHMNTKGTLFRWREDPFQHIYRIKKVRSSQDSSSNSSGVFNYGDSKKARKSPENKTIRLYIWLEFTGWRLDTHILDTVSSTALTPHGYEENQYHLHVDDVGKVPFYYKGDYDQPIVTHGGVVYDKWKPTRRGWGTDVSTSYKAGSQGGAGNWDEIGQYYYSSFNETIELTNHIEIMKQGWADGIAEFAENPAIFETEPKEDVGLDIYYEASQAYPTKLNDQTNELFAPYGAKVESKDVINITNYHQGIPSYPNPSSTDLTLWFPTKKDGRLNMNPNAYIEDWAPTGHGGDNILLNFNTNELAVYNTAAPIVFDNTGLFVTTPTNLILPVPGGQPLPINPLENPMRITNPHFQSAYGGWYMWLNTVFAGAELRFVRPDGSYTTAKIKELGGWQHGVGLLSSLNYPSPPTLHSLSDRRMRIKLDRDVYGLKTRLSYFNCYAFGNGVESNRIRDDYNAVTLDKGVKASTVLAEPYKEEIRKTGLIFSGIYNSTSGVNNLNQFIQAEAITKDLNPTYGSIQKLFSRDTNLVTFCEDKVLKILANKDAIYNADGNPNLVANNNVLGQTTPFAGEFGISKNPESFAQDAYRLYFADRSRGKVLRLSGDGITPISDVGMKDYFGDNLRNNSFLIGSFDDKKGEYNLTLKQIYNTNIGTTISFSETVKGWTSFKSFVQQNGISMNNEYYTFFEGKMWKHHVNETRNNFYDNQHDSYVDILFNEESGSVKNFGSMNYEGSQARITENLTDGEYYNNIGKEGWYIENGNTDLEEASTMEFKDKEGKWFTYMKGKKVTTVNDLNSKQFSFQGIDEVQSITTAGVVMGCTDPLATNYDPNANTDDGSCILPIYGCTDPTATNYNVNANTDDGSCVYTPIVQGCTDPLATNYDPNATVDDGSCVYPPPVNPYTITVQDLGDQD